MIGGRAYYIFRDVQAHPLGGVTRITYL